MLCESLRISGKKLKIFKSMQLILRIDKYINYCRFVSYFFTFQIYAEFEKYFIEVKCFTTCCLPAAKPEVLSYNLFPRQKSIATFKLLKILYVKLILAPLPNSNDKLSITLIRYFLFNIVNLIFESFYLLSIFLFLSISI